MPKFKIGEIAIINYSGNAGPKGTECEVMGYIKDSLSAEDYKIKVPGNESSPGNNGWWNIGEQDLSKKKPPKEDKTKEKDKGIPLLNRGDMDKIVTWDEYYKSIERETETVE